MPDESNCRGDQTPAGKASLILHDVYARFGLGVPWKSNLVSTLKSCGTLYQYANGALRVSETDRGQRAWKRIVSNGTTLLISSKQARRSNAIGVIASMENPDRMIRHFLKIAELGSLSKAADYLEITQSGLSRSLSSLEDEIGKPLFFRNGRGVELTFAGKKLFEAAKPAYFGVDAALEAIRDRLGVSEGQVRVAVIHTLSYYFMADVVAVFLGRHPGVNLSLMGRSSSEVVALVAGRGADLGFVYDSAVDAECIRSAPLFEDKMCVISSSHDNLPDELDLNTKTLKAVAFPDHYALGRMLRSSGIGLEIVARAETVDAMLRLVSARVGLCILPERIPERLLADYGLKKTRILQPRMSRLVVAITREDKPVPPFVDNLIQIAQASVGAGKV